MAGQLAVQVTSFIGRQTELSEVVALLGQFTVLTLTGPGGTGKTRLAIEAARRILDAEVDSVYFIDLARVLDPGLVELAVMAALGGRQESGHTPLETIVGLLSASRSLLLMDNCEHLVQPVSGLAEALVRAVPGLCLLATSREPLGIGGEAVWTVPPLTDADASQLFIERARFAKAEFRTNDVASVVELCRSLDGLPLAIELAAARVRQMPPTEILSRLDDRFALLTKGERWAIPRHKTLDAAISWSYGLLDVNEQSVFANLSVFVGGFDLDAADAVTGC